MTDPPIRKLEGMDLHHDRDNSSTSPSGVTETETATIPSEMNINTTANTSQSRMRLPVRTYHCRFCSHLLVATTRDLSRLPRRRKPPAMDGAVILPLSVNKDGEGDGDGDGEAEEHQNETEIERDGDGDQEGGDIEQGRGEGEAPTTTATTATSPKPEIAPQSQRNKGTAVAHLTLLLSTTYSDRKHTVIRREDGFEKRRLLRCGRCRLVVGYFLDADSLNPTKNMAVGSSSTLQEEDAGGEDPRVVYILPGALVETSGLDDEEKMKAGDQEWASWVKD